MLAQTLRLPDEARLLTPGSWMFERKLDGLRCVAVRDGDEVSLWSRNQLSFDRRFPALRAAVAALPAASFVLDGEIVAFDDSGRARFQLLQTGRSGSEVLVAFDLLFLLGRDVRPLPLHDRRDLLARLLGPSGPLSGNPRPSGDPGDRQTASVRLSEKVSGHDPVQLLAAACAQGWEGLVAKRADSAYRSGRSPDWRKLKCSARQEMVIGGWSEPSGSRIGFGALLVGYFDDTGLRYAGKVGTGFDERTLRSLHAELQAREVPEAPFVDVPKMAGSHWCWPELVGEVAFTEWTRDGRMRHPSFVGLRPDKEPRSVVREDRPSHE